jgi:hypothetical protein
VNKAIRDEKIAKKLMINAAKARASLKKVQKQNE